MALSNCKELKKEEMEQLMGNYFLMTNTFLITFFPALRGGDDEGDRAATPYSNRTTSTLAVQEFGVN